MTTKIEKYDLSPAVLRQRRNLMVVSLIILFIVFAGAKIEKVSLMGNEVSFENPEVIFLYLKGFLLYFLYRYYLYVKQEPDLYLKETFYLKLYSLTHKKIQKAKDEKFPDATTYGGEYDFRKMKKISRFTRQVTGVKKDPNKFMTEEVTFEINILFFYWEGMRALIHTVFNKSYATDYLLPFLVAFTALVSGWQYHG